MIFTLLTGTFQLMRWKKNPFIVIQATLNSIRDVNTIQDNFFKLFLNILFGWSYPVNSRENWSRNFSGASVSELTENVLGLDNRSMSFPILKSLERTLSNIQPPDCNTSNSTGLYDWRNWTYYQFRKSPDNSTCRRYAMVECRILKSERFG